MKLPKKGDKNLINVFWMSFDKLIRMFVGLFIGIWLARYLGPSEFGVLSYSLSLFGILLFLSSLGMDEVIVRELVIYENDKEQVKSILGTSFVLRFTGSLLVILGAVAVNVLLNNDSAVFYTSLVIASSSVIKSFNVLDFYFQARKKNSLIGKVNITGFIIGASLKLLGILLQLPLEFFVWVIVLETLVIDLGFIVLYVREGERIREWRFINSLAKKIMGLCWPLIFSGLLIALYMKMDQLMIMNFMGANAVGSYAAASRISESWYFLPMVLGGVFFPAIIKARSTSVTEYYSKVNRLYNLLTGLGYLVAAITTFLGPFVMNLLYGSQYDGSGEVLVIHIWASVFVFIGVLSNKQLLLQDKQKIILLRGILGVALNWVLNFVLIPLMGIKGAAIATFVSQIVTSYLFYLFVPGCRMLFLQQSKALLFPFSFVVEFLKPKAK